MNAIEGLEFQTNNCGRVVVIKQISTNKVLVRFLDTDNTTTVWIHNLLKGEVRDKLKPSVFGIGICDIRCKYNGIKTDEYLLWVAMLNRCYSEKFHRKNPTYKGCYISDNFKYLSFFSDWCEKQIGYKVVDDNGQTFHLDKDILQKGNKIYSEDNCCFVPREINSLIVKRESMRGELPIGVAFNKQKGKYSSIVSYFGTPTSLGYYDNPLDSFVVYKRAKEQYIKEVAEKWKGKIDSKVYHALLTYEVSFED
jgi:hypothetical protein